MKEAIEALSDKYQAEHDRLAKELKDKDFSKSLQKCLIVKKRVLELVISDLESALKTH